MRMKFCLGILLVIGWGWSGALAAKKVIKDQQGMDCYVFFPDEIDKQREYQLIVGVHGAGGRGKSAGGFASWIERGDVIVIGPSFHSRTVNGVLPYQNGGGPHAAKLLALFAELKKEFKLKDKMFIAGFSGGSQFVHRFAMLHPEVVCGVAAHSGGSWATKGYGKYNKNAKSIPFAISCGAKDKGKAWGAAPMGRLEWFEEFRKNIENDGFAHIAEIWPDVGHGMSAGAKRLSAECFQLATGLPGGRDGNAIEISAGWNNIDHLKKRMSPQTEVASDKIPDKNQEVDKIAMNTALKEGIRQAEEGQISDKILVNFMQKYPPIYWKNQASATSLLLQCRRASKNYEKVARSKGIWNEQTQKKFSHFSQGLFEGDQTK